MPPLLLLLLLFAALPLASPLLDCQGHTACLHIVSCFYVSPPKPGVTRPPLNPDVKVMSQDLGAAIEMRNTECADGVGLISTLAILSTSHSSLNVSFETDLRYAELYIGKPEDENYLRFHTGNDSMIKMNSKAKMNELSRDLDVTKSASVESYGRTIYSFELDDPDKERFDAFIGKTIYFKVREDGDPYMLNDKLREMEKFLKQLKDNLACDKRLVQDACDDHTNCSKAVIGGHSINCTSPAELKWNMAGAEWNPLESVSCNNDQQWILTAQNRVMARTEKFRMLCSLPATTTATTTTTTLAPATVITMPTPSIATTTPSDATTVVTTSESTTMPTTASPNETVVDHPDPIGQTAGNDSSRPSGPPPKPQPIVEGESKEEQDKRLPGNKWMWIGIAAGVLAMIALVNVIGCMLCRRKSNKACATKVSKKSEKSSPKRKRSEKSSPKRKSKKKSAKQKKDDESSSAQPESSEKESKAEAPEKTVERKPLLTQKSVHPTVSSDATEMHLDRLKTEVIN